MTGTLHGIGVGPGDPELMTLKAARLVAACPVVAWPAPLEGDSFARRIAAAHIRVDATEIAIRMPLAADRFPVAAVYDEAAAAIGGHLAVGRDVAVLCEGDPFLYGSFMYLFARLADRWPTRIVPGVTSLAACAAAARQPLAAGNDTLCVIPAPLPDSVIRARLDGCDAAAIIKLGRHLPRVRGVLEAAGLLGRSTYVAHASLPDARVAPLAEIDDAPAPYFSMILVHRTAGVPA
ncbi:MAG: precorrin-2 C(20)-methyltransferase [Alphaproteobacteria bacterium]|nr:precorrin-2 C(20)-methyltransferase [Alphaproteobacteria bacterium]